MTRFRFIFLLLMAVSACCMPIPKVPVDLSGVMEILESDYPAIRGVFSVDSRRNRFAIFFIDELEMPRGSVLVERGKVSVKGALFDYNAAELFRYWSFIFGNGRKTSDMSFRDIEVAYGKWLEVGGKHFPRVVDIISGNRNIQMRIIYGNPGSG